MFFDIPRTVDIFFLKLVSPFKMPFPAARGSEDDEEEIASPPFETLDTTHLSPPPVDAISSLIRYLEESRFQLITDAFRMTRRGASVTRRDDYVTTKPGEKRRTHVSKSLSHFSLLGTDRILRRAHGHLFTSTTPRCSASGATPKVASPATSTALLAASPAAATPTVATSAGRHVAHSPRHCWPIFPFPKVFRQWRRLWEDYLPCWIHRGCHDTSNSSS
ncbi:hypothetical protein GWK47_006335 [Chionoecetes opilio]|uniref:Uncharacterized protein n=1 Tax=Chionoecetes opilio TaxID=41210 RepID=A0A8J5CWE1_CHIOP|nr:hypothetical protein GWK47_006335 [Chionoecetes opilio]